MSAVHGNRASNGLLVFLGCLCIPFPDACPQLGFMHPHSTDQNLAGGRAGLWTDSCAKGILWYYILYHCLPAISISASGLPSIMDADCIQGCSQVLPGCVLCASSEERPHCQAIPARSALTHTSLNALCLAVSWLEEGMCCSLAVSGQCGDHKTPWLPRTPPTPDQRAHVCFETTCGYLPMK